VNKDRGKGRFDSLKNVFSLYNRIIDPLNQSYVDSNLLIKKPNINQTLLNQLRNISINYLKKNLGLF